MKSRLLVFTAFVFAASPLFAQAPPKPPAAPAPPAPPPAGSRQPINIKVDVTISEEGGGAVAVKKTVSTVAGDGFSGSVRETATVSTPNRAPGTIDFSPTALNVDASPVLLSNGKIRVGFNFQYSAGQNAPAGDGRGRTDIRQSLVLILENGKSLVVSEAADPLVTDRHVTIEVKATILK